MRKPLIKEKEDIQVITENKNSFIKKQKTNIQMDSMRLNRLLNKKRSNDYVQIFKNLDAGGHLHNQYQVEEILAKIEEEFPEISLQGQLLGVVSACYLGYPYEVHTLDMTLNIIEHYHQGEPLPNGLERARNLAIRGNYLCIEVYLDCCRAISDNGRVSVFQG